jgi:hypothetical protein
LKKLGLGGAQETKTAPLGHEQRFGIGRILAFHG